MNHQDLINTCVFEQIQGLLFSDLSGPLMLIIVDPLSVVKIPNMYSFNLCLFTN